MYEGGENDDFDYVDDNHQQPDSNNQALGLASNLIGGLGDAIESGNDGQSALEKELLGIEDNGPSNDTFFKVKVFINMDEDDDRSKQIDLKQLFNLNSSDQPFNLSVSISKLLILQHINFYFQIRLNWRITI